MPTKPRITLWFEGLMVFFAREGEDHCTLGVLHDVADHTFSIEIWKTDDLGGRTLFLRLGTNELDRHLSLIVLDSIGSVRFSRGPQFNRDDNDEADDIRWALDLENDLYQEQVNVTRGGFRAFMRITAGSTYFSSRVSVDEVAQADRLPGGGTGASRQIGRVATAIGGYVYLNQRARPATFRSGAFEKSLRFGRGENYEIRVSHGSGFDPLSTGNDAEVYEDVVPSAVSGRKLRLGMFGDRADPGELGAGDPHAVCLIPRLPLAREP